jgi:hypothetical protein
MSSPHAVEEKVGELERAIRDVVYLQHKNEMQINQLSVEMVEFKNEMKDFKNEMSDFKVEMSEFKNEMSGFKNEMKEESRRMNKQWGELSNKLGTIVEDLVAPAINPVVRKYFNLEPEYTAIHVKRKKGKLQGEFDALAVCGDQVFLFEVKATVRKEYILEFSRERLERFRVLFPEYKEKIINPVFASLRIEPEFLKILSREGVYAMAYREWETMEILNFDTVYKKLRG